MQYSRFDKKEIFRWSLSKELFPSKEESLSPKVYSLGSVQSYDLKYVASSANMVGVRASNRRIDSNIFDTRNIYENGPPRWKVELFINGTYIGETLVDLNGVFKFENVPIFYGNNDLIYRFTSPIGQTYEFTREYNVLNDFAGAGQLSYQVAYGQLENTTMNTGSAQLGYGLSSKISLNAGFFEAPLEEEKKQYLSYGAVMMGDFCSVGFSTTEELNSGGDFWSVSPKVNWNGYLFSSEYASFRGFRSEKINRLPEETQITDMNVSILKRIDFTIPIVAQVIYGKEEFDLAPAATLSRLRAYSMMGGESLLLEVERRWQYTESSDLYLEYGNYNRLFRGKLGFLQGSNRDSIVRITLEKNFSNSLYLTSGFDLSERTDQNSYTVSMNKLFSKMLVEVRASHFLNETIYSLSLSSNFRFSSDGVELSSEESFQSGRIRLYAFIDTNGDGIKNPEEIGLKGLRVLHVQRQKEYETDESGKASIKNVTPYQRITLEIARESVLNIYLSPSDLNYDVAVTPGQELTLYIPVGPTFDVRGNLENPHFKKLVPIELCGLDGKVVAQTTTSATGKFRFEDIKPGDYFIRVNDAFLKENSLIMSRYSEVKVAGKPGVILASPLAIISSEPTREIAPSL